MRLPALITATFVLSGCHSYVAVPSGALPEASEARVVLTDRGAADLARYVGPYSRALAGGVLSKSDSALALSVHQVVRSDGIDELWKGEHVVVPRDAIAEVQVRKLSPVRTALFSGGIVASAVALAAIFGGDVFGGGEGDDLPRPD